MSDFVALQQQWTNWLRHPQTAPQPQPFRCWSRKPACRNRR